MLPEPSLHFIRFYSDKAGRSYQACTKCYSVDEKTNYKVLFIDTTENLAFKASVNNEDILKMKSNSRNLDVDKLLKSALTSSDPKFLFSVIDDHKSMRITFEDHELGVIAVGIVKDGSKAHRKMFELAVKADAKNEEKLNGLKVRLSNLKSTLEEHNNSLKTMIDEKVKIENRMFGQFLPFLRTKDEKINQLQQKIQTLRQNSSEFISQTSQSPNFEMSQDSREESASSRSPISMASQSSSDFELNLESSPSPVCVTLSSSSSEERHNSNSSISILN